MTLTKVFYYEMVFEVLCFICKYFFILTHILGTDVYKQLINSERLYDTAMWKN